MELPTGLDIQVNQCLWVASDCGQRVWAGQLWERCDQGIWVHSHTYMCGQVRSDHAALTSTAHSKMQALQHQLDCCMMAAKVNVPMVVPTLCRYNLKLRLFKPRSASAMQSFLSWVTGMPAEFSDSRFPSYGEGREGRACRLLKNACRQYGRQLKHTVVAVVRCWQDISACIGVRDSLARVVHRFCACISWHCFTTVFAGMSPMPCSHTCGVQWACHCAAQCADQGHGGVRVHRWVRQGWQWRNQALVSSNVLASSVEAQGPLQLAGDVRCNSCAPKRGLWGL
jgi:hypothetical protein